MLLKNYFIFLTLLFLPLLGFAQKYQQGTIFLVSGEKKIGSVKPPNDPYEKKIEYKADEKADVIKFLSAEVKEVQVTVNGLEHRFVREKARRPKVREPKTDEDYKYYEPLWLVEMVSGYATLYATGPLLKLKEDGRLRIELNWNGRGVPPDINFYGIKKDQKTPTFVAMYSQATMGQTKIFKYWCARFFSDHPTLPARIEKGEFKHTEIADVFEEYNQWKKKN
jgi:hypothetical protein